jgi:hypothetical protein
MDNIMRLDETKRIVGEKITLLHADVIYYLQKIGTSNA